MSFAADHSVHAAHVGTPASRALARSIEADEAAVRRDARRRLLQAGLESDALARERPRVTTLLPTSSAAAAVALLLLQLFLGQGSLG
jgi:hypothetical protein